MITTGVSAHGWDGSLTCDMEGCRSRMETAGPDLDAIEANVEAAGWHRGVVIEPGLAPRDLCPFHWDNFTAGNGDYPVDPAPSGANG